jgi:hypothetical protein
MGLSDGAFLMVKHTPLPNGNHPILIPICPMGVADTLGQEHVIPQLNFPQPVLPEIVSRQL